ncbi:MAG: SDR family NAD(P)-dependent oxidoreductase [Clostridia bacterium]|nr:SDR family NAD(P)-dependent oxidoreductase [Clostridia bacterium]
MSLEQLVKISNYYGEKPEFVLAGGGNTSYKTDEHLYIKGSGTTLADITEQGFVKMNRSALAKMWERQYSKDNDEREAQVLEDLMDARERIEYNKRPSVETSLHDLFSQRYVVHTHPALINGITCSQQGKNAVERLFKDEAIWVDATKPGYILAAAVREEIKKYREKFSKDPDIVFLGNHGIFIAADTIEEIKKITDYVVNKIKDEIKNQPDFSQVQFDRQRAAEIAPAIRMLLKQENRGSIVTFRTNKQVMELVKDEQSFAPVSSAYSPDHIVYCRYQPLFIPCFEDIDEQYDVIESKVKEYKDKNQFMPKIIAVQNLGFFAHGENKKNADIAADVFMDAVKISVYTQAFGGHKFLSDELIRFINEWEVESYRSKIGLAVDDTKRLSDKIAIVTGSAQGFGKGIAEEMVKQGANMVIADLNYPMAEENAANLTGLYGKGRAIAVKVNVADEKDVNDMVINTVLEYGGLDVFVNNAGVVRAGSLEEMNVEDFDFVTKINYNAYFICAKYASKPMKIQHRFNKEYFMDIIQVNSKSGLAGSNKNFAYAGSKFGGVGLTQSFALELVEYNIKVNSVCPGNFYDGPLWSDPEKGLFVQYLQAGKVPGAKTVEDVKKAYEAKTPIRRGCTVKDVAKAIFYIIEQEYETGQAVPVTGGQIMLN